MSDFTQFWTLADARDSGLDTSKYTGSMNYVAFSAQDEDYWRIPCQGVTVQNNQVANIVRFSS